MNRSLKLIIGLLFVSSLAFGQAERRINKEYDNSVFKSLQINNSFGDIEITPYSGSKIEVLIVVSVEKVKGWEASEFLDNIAFDFVESGSTLAITTRKPEDKVKHKKIENFSMDYKVKIPENLNVEINNSFGDLKMNGTSGTLKVKLRHGDCFIAYANGKENDLDVQFGDVRIEAISKTKIDMQHGDLHIEKAHDLMVNSQFGDININRLGGNSVFDVAHGDLEIDNLSSKFNALEIEVQFGDVDIHGLGELDVEMQLLGNFAEFSYDHSWAVSSQSNGINTSNFIINTVSGSTSGKRLKIEASHSDVDLD